MRASTDKFRQAVFAALIAGISLMAAPVLASVPISITQQGKILEEDGSPLTGEQTLEFAIYDDRDDGTILWSDSVTTTLNDAGVYTVVLGDEEQPIDSELLREDELYLGLTAGSQEMVPRMELTSVPFASLAHTAEVAESVADGSITADALASDAVGWDQIIDVPSNVSNSSDTLGELSCSGNNVAVYDGSQWGCGSQPSYSGSDFATSGQSCPGDDVAVGITASGQIECASDVGGTTYSAGTGLELSGDQFSVDTSYLDSNYLASGQDIAMGNNDIDFGSPNGFLHFRDVSINAPSSDQLRVQGGDMIVEDGRIGAGDNFSGDPIGPLHADGATNEQVVVQRSGNNNGWSMGTAITQNLWFQFNDDLADGNFGLNAWISADDGSFNESSDRRLKQDIDYLDGVLDDILELAPATYRYRRAGDDSRRSYGFIAQEVQKLFPELVRYEEEFGHHGLSYGDFAVLAVQGIREQQQIIDEQRAELQEMEKRQESMEERLRQLEAQ